MAPILIDGVEHRRCECGALFVLGRNRFGQRVTRRLCDDCRRLRESRVGMNLPEPPDLRKCSDCGAWEGIDYGTASALDDRGRCPACAGFEARRLERARREAEGQHFAGGIWFAPRPSREPLWNALRRAEKPENLPDASQPVKRWEGGLSAILAHHALSWERVVAADRSAEVIAARAEVAAYQRWRGHSLGAIADMLGVHPTTVGYYLDTWSLTHGGEGCSYRPSRGMSRQIGAAKVLAWLEQGA